MSSRVTNQIQHVGGLLVRRVDYEQRKRQRGRSVNFWIYTSVLRWRNERVDEHRVSSGPIKSTNRNSNQMRYEPRLYVHIRVARVEAKEESTTKGYRESIKLKEMSVGSRHEPGEI